MSKNTDKKEILAKYKERKIIGGVFLTRNTKNNKILLECTTDLQGSKNRFDFSKITNSCVSMKLQKDWAEFGSEVFIFEVLEELEKSGTQTPQEFRADVELLMEIWAEKLEGEKFY